VQIDGEVPELAYNRVFAENDLSQQYAWLNKTSFLFNNTDHLDRNFSKTESSQHLVIYLSSLKFEIVVMENLESVPRPPDRNDIKALTPFLGRSLCLYIIICYATSKLERIL